MQGSEWNLNLQLFADGGAAGGDAAPGGDNAGLSAVTGNETILEDGTRVDRRFAERMEKQRKKHPEKNLYQSAAAGDQENQGTNPQAAKTPDEEFEELIKGRYAEAYQKRFQTALNDRFRNQADLQGQLDGLKPMLDALAQQHGIEAGDYKALSDAILDDDSLYEDEAEEHGMTVEAYKAFKALETEAAQAREAKKAEEERMFFNNHLQNLATQGEELKKTFPDFDLKKELANPVFRRLTAPNSGLSVADAYYAVHHAEIAPRAVQAGIRHATTQISQSLAANAGRPVEGAMQGSSGPANVSIDPRNLTRAQREEIKARVRKGEKIYL